MKPSLLCLAFAFFLLPAALRAELVLPGFFSEGMVLQRDREASIWGKATPGAEVVVEFKGARASAKADESGKWRAAITTGAADANGPKRPSKGAMSSS